ncbi:hypothetical protein HAX54_008857, partial [Datura stramonium]|nr:hypothetical protein [Datura stramonium]
RAVGPKAKRVDENWIRHIGCLFPCLPFELLRDNLPYIDIFIIHDSWYQDFDLNGNMCCVFGGNDTGAY